ncbi:hypothetical protein MMC07_000088 [Pseudocyphellaria aurata]|nr:hypothetical protein [Pseudocyphellaria aurata]
MVIVWLGECDDQSKQAMQWISNISDAFKACEEMGGASDVEIVSAGAPPPGHKYWAAIQSLLQRPYFTRMWTTPEIKVSRARKVVCGREEMSWQTLVDFNRRIRLQTQFPYRFFPRGTLPGLELIESISDLWIAEAENEPYGLLDVLRFFRQRLTSDPRDKIIAPLGLAINLGPSFDPLIDYTQTVAELYTRTARMIIDRDCNLDILWSAGKAMQKHQLPSWVPDWTVPSNAALGMIAKEGFEIRAYKKSEELDVVYHATDLSKSDFMFISSEEGELLRVRAMIYGSINWVGTSLQYLDEEADPPVPITAEVQLSRLRDCFSAAEQCRPYANGEDCISACQQTLFAGCERGLVYGEFSYAKIEPHKAAQYTNHFFTVVEMSAQDRAGSEAGEIVESNAIEPYLQGYDIFQSSLNEKTTGRRVVTMHDRYVGLASVGSQIGDRICVILGCNVPFVIRSIEGGNYVLVGECYIHGLMHGEALRNPDRSFEHISLR